VNGILTVGMIIRYASTTDGPGSGCLSSMRSCRIRAGVW